MRLLGVIALFVIGCSARPSETSLGNLPKIGQQLRTALEDVECQKKVEVLDSILSGDFQSLQTEYSLPAPDFGDLNQNLPIILNLLKKKSADFDCEQKAELLDGILEGKISKVAKMIKISPDPKTLMKHLAKKLRTLTQDMTCEEKNQIFDLILQGKYQEIGEKLQIEVPKFDRRMSEHVERLSKGISAKIQDLNCDQKAAVFDALLNGGQHSALKKTSKTNAVEVLNEVKGAIKGMSCEEKNVIFDLVLDGKINEAATKLGLKLDFDIPQKLPPYMEKIAEKIKKSTENLSCEVKAGIFDRLVGGNLSKLVEKLLNSN